MMRQHTLNKVTLWLKKGREEYCWVQGVVAMPHRAAEAKIVV